MMIDERLERLTQRHEALAESLELLAHGLRELEVRVTKTTENLDKLVGIVAEQAGFINTLARIAETHDRRLNNLEGGQPA